MRLELDWVKAQGARFSRVECGADIGRKSHGGNDSKISVLLVEDHHVMLECLHSWMEKTNEFQVVGKTGNAAGGFFPQPGSGTTIFLQVDISRADGSR